MISISNPMRLSGDQSIKVKLPEHGASKTQIDSYQFCEQLRRTISKEVSSREAISKLYLTLKQIDGKRANQMAALVGGLAKKSHKETFGKLALQGDSHSRVSFSLIGKAIEQVGKESHNPKTQACLKQLKSALPSQSNLKATYVHFKQAHPRTTKILETLIAEEAGQTKKPKFGQGFLQGGSSDHVSMNAIDRAIARLFQQLDKENLAQSKVSKNQIPVQHLKKAIANCTKTPLKEEEIEKILRVAKKSFPQLKAVKLDRKQNNLARTVLVNAKTAVILMTRCKKKGDQLVGKGGFKKIKFAVDLEGTRKIVGVSRRTKSMSSAAWKGLGKEVAIMEKCKGVRGVIQLDFAVAKESKYYVVMEYCNGGDLHGALADGRLSFKENLTIAIDTAEGMKHLHRKKIFHRDLYPKNIFLIRKEGKVVQAKVADLGMATVQGEFEDPNSGLFDWPSPWFSPEQARAKLFKGSKGDKAKRWLAVSTDKSDVWSLGLTFYKMFNPNEKGFACQGDGLVKQSAENKAKRITSMTNEKLEKEVRESGISPEIGQLILKMVRIKPEERISMDEVHQTLQKIAKKHLN